MGKTVPPLITALRPTSVISEQFRTLRTNIQFAMVDRDLKTISVTSATPDAGKTTVSANLAVTFASQEKKVLLVDADMRKPTVHKVFGVKNTNGLTSLLTHQSSKVEEYVIGTPNDNLFIMPSGPIPPNPAELLGTNRMSEIINEMKQYFDLIIFDTPPTLAVTDSQVITTKVDGTIVVMRYGFVKKEQAIKTKELLEKVDAKILGAVLNRAEVNGDNYYYYGE